jgi:HCOMODA/2-hydroxy-3-carboxy-muconic semialdehyde decarboxylase
VAARALGRHGLVHAYGHCSLRLDEAHFLVAPSRPLGLVAPGETCAVVPLERDLPEGVLGEVRIHREIYRRRAEVKGAAPCRHAP